MILSNKCVCSVSSPPLLLAVVVLEFPVVLFCSLPPFVVTMPLSIEETDVDATGGAVVGDDVIRSDEGAEVLQVGACVELS